MDNGSGGAILLNHRNSHHSKWRGTLGGAASHRMAKGDTGHVFPTRYYILLYLGTIRVVKQSSTVGRKKVLTKKHANARFYPTTDTAADVDRVKDNYANKRGGAGVAAAQHERTQRYSVYSTSL